jgi:TRAP-type uncharacterized transport system substrate-binding protein
LRERWRFLLVAAQVSWADAKLDCGPAVNKSIQLPRTIAIGTNPAGTGAHAIASGLAAIASKTTQVSARVQPYNGPNAWMPLLESGEIEFGIINILDSHMAATGTGNYKKAYPGVRIVAGGVFPFTAGLIVRDKSESSRCPISKANGSPGITADTRSIKPGSWR